MKAGRPAKSERAAFGARLHTLRETVGLTQQQVAEQLGITQASYAFWERRNVALRADQLARLAEILGVTMDALIIGEPQGKASIEPKVHERQLGERLRHFRQAAGLSQRELAQRLGMHHSNIGYWERSGNLPGPEILLPAAKILGVTVAAIIGEDKRSAKMSAAPSGRARLAFEAVSRLPKRQQQKIVEVVEAFVAQHAVGQ